MIHQTQTLTLPLSLEAQRHLAAFAAAKALGNHPDAREHKHRYRRTRWNEREQEWLARERERFARDRQLWLVEELRRRREEMNRANGEAFLDSFDRLPTGKVPAWRLIRTPNAELDWLGSLRSFYDRSNWNKRNCGRKPRRSW